MSSSRLLWEYLEPSRYVDSDAPAVQSFARTAVGSATEPLDRAARLFEAVRDGFWYDPFSMTTDPAAFRDVYSPALLGGAESDTDADRTDDAFARPGPAA